MRIVVSSAWNFYGKAIHFRGEATNFRGEATGDRGEATNFCGEATGGNQWPFHIRCTSVCRLPHLAFQDSAFSASEDSAPSTSQKDNP